MEGFAGGVLEGLQSLQGVEQAKALTQQYQAQTQLYNLQAQKEQEALRTQADEAEAYRRGFGPQPGQPGQPAPAGVMGALGQPPQPGQQQPAFMPPAATAMGGMGGPSMYDKAQTFLGNQLDTAEEMARRGHPNRASDIFKGAVENLTHLTTARKTETDRQLQMMARETQTVEEFHRLTGGIKDQKTLDSAKFAWMASHPHETLPSAFNLPYSELAPKLKFIRENTKSALEAQKQKMDIIETQAKTANERAHAALADAEAAIKRQERGVNEARIAAIEKAGGKGSFTFGDVTAKTSSKQTGMAATRAYNIHEGFLQAGADLINVTHAPGGTTLGAFAGLAGKSGDDLREGLAATLTRKYGSSDKRMLQQMVSGLEQNLARVIGGGYASSGAKHVVDSYKEQIFREGDKPENTAMFLARVKQELQISHSAFKTHPGASEEQYRDQEKLLAELEHNIPFTVWDVQRATIGSRSTMTEALRGRFGGSGAAATGKTETGKTYTHSRPAGMTDTEWADYKKAVGAK